MDAPLEPWLGEHSGKTTLLHPGWHQRRGPIKHRFWWYGTTSAWDAIRSTPSASPPHLSGRTQRDEEDACVGKGLTKSDQGRKALVESLCTAPSTAGKDASGGKTMVVVVAFFSLTDGSQQFQNDSFKMFCFVF